MTAFDAIPAPLEPGPPATSAESAAPLAPGLIDRWTLRVGEFLNPILVKEGRQALKSRQFSVPFLLVLICCLLWSFFGGAGALGDVYYGALGWSFFMGYFVILAFPLLVIVPFGAFRSLTAEREDGTYELLSITTLRPSQVVNGKLSSAIMQMVVYLSAVSPCIAFTYLLRGIDLLSIALILFWLICESLLLCVVTLMLATLTTARHWQILMTVLVISALIFVFVMTLSLVGNVLFMSNFVPLGSVTENWEFWVGNLTVLSGVICATALAYSVSQAQLKFPTDNRSTAVRMVMLATSAVFTGWFCWGIWVFEDDTRSVTIPVMIASFFFFPYWFFMGSFLIGEYGELSRRVRRMLPHGFLGRMLIAWFVPGSGTGYVFTLCCAFGGAAFAVVGSLIARSIRGVDSATFTQMLQVLSYLSLYLVALLGFCRLLVLGLRRRLQVGAVASMLISFLVFVFACLFPWMLELAARGNAFTGPESVLIQTTNPFYVMAETVDRNTPLSDDIWLIQTGILGVFGLCIFLLNLPSILREIRQQRSAAPTRVQEENRRRRAPARDPDEYISPFADV